MGIQQGYGSGVIASTAQPPALVSPVAHQVSYGLIRGVAAPGSKRVVVRVDGHVRGREKLVRRAFVVDLDLPLGVHTIRVETSDGKGHVAVTTVSDVYGLPRVARPRLRSARLDPALEATVRRLARGFGSSSGIYVQSLTTGKGAAWNAQAQFPAASSLKLAIAVTALAELDGTPKRGSTADGLLRTMLVYSDNGSANRLETLFGGSTSGGSALVNAMMRSIGLEHTEMYGGYTLDSATSRFRELASGGIPLTVVDQSWWGRGKRTTAYDLAQLTRSIWLASGGLGPLREGEAWIFAGRRSLSPARPRRCTGHGKARSAVWSPLGRQGLPQGGLDLERPPRQRSHRVARRGFRRRGDDLPLARCGHLVGRARRARRRCCERPVRQLPIAPPRRPSRSRYSF